MDDSISSLPDEMMSFLYDGVVPPVYVASSESASDKGSLASTLDIAEAEIGLFDEKVYLNKVTFSGKSKLSYVSEDVQHLIDSVVGQAFDKQGMLVLNAIVKQYLHHGQ